MVILNFRRHADAGLSAAALRDVWSQEIHQAAATGDARVDMDLSGPAPFAPGRPLSAEACRSIVGALRGLDVAFEDIHLSNDEIIGFLLAGFPHAPSLGLASVSDTRSHSSPSTVVTRLTLDSERHIPVALPHRTASNLTYLCLNGGVITPEFPPCPNLSTLLFDSCTLSSPETWYTLLHSCPSLRLVGMSYPSPYPPLDAFTSSHLPPSLSHIALHGISALWDHGANFLHALPPTVESLTLTQPGHLQVRARVLAGLRWECKRKGIGYREVLTGLRRWPSFTLERWAEERGAAVGRA